jgi:hypothetical protein
MSTATNQLESGPELPFVLDFLRLEKIIAKHNRRALCRICPKIPINEV